MAAGVVIRELNVPECAQSPPGRTTEMCTEAIPVERLKKEPNRPRESEELSEEPSRVEFKAGMELKSGE